MISLWCRFWDSFVCNIKIIHQNHSHGHWHSLYALLWSKYQFTQCLQMALTVYNFIYVFNLYSFDSDANLWSNILNGNFKNQLIKDFFLISIISLLKLLCKYLQLTVVIAVLLFFLCFQIGIMYALTNNEIDLIAFIKKSHNTANLTLTRFWWC